MMGLFEVHFVQRNLKIAAQIFTIMTEFLLFCIATVGMTSIITQGVIFQPFRQFFGDWAEQIREQRELKAQAIGRNSRRSCVEWFSEMINCAQCAGFWCGLFCGLFLVAQCDFSMLYKPIGVEAVDGGFRWKKIGLDFHQAAYFLLMWFCCGLGGSFLSALGCNAIDWVFYRKMNALRQLEEQDIMLADRRANLEARE
jgi:hypothetical protein